MDKPVRLRRRMGISGFMKKLGLIGGLSWTSTARYYQIINQAVYRARGGQHSAPLLIESLDFADIGRSTRSEEHTSELQSLMRISYAVFCLKKKTKRYINNN